VADLLTAEIPAPAGTAGQVAAQAEADYNAHRYNRTGEMLKSRMPDAVKGAGLAPKGGNAVLSDQMDIMTRATQATLDLRSETYRGFQDKTNVVKSFSPDFMGQFGYLKTALSAPSLAEQLGQVFQQLPGGGDAYKSFTAGNLGIGSIYGLTPFNLLAPSRLIYPVYTVYRNKFPRPAGQGASLIERLFTGISGSQTGGQGVQDVSIPELVTQGGNFGTWPLNLPPSGSQTEVTLNVPYRFFGITEQLSWLAQFSGQGFEDISALANLIMLQEMMLGEEYQMIAGTSSNLPVPSAPTCVVRSAQSNETALATTVVNVYVQAVNYFGATAASSATAVTVAANQVVDVTISPVAGAMQYNIIVATSTPTYYQFATCGGVKYTLQGNLPGTSISLPSTDSGTGKGTRMEGVVSVLSGQSATTGVYPSGWTGGYFNGAVGQHLNYNTVYTALKALWDSTTGSTTNGPFKADPAELISSGSDLTNLSQDVISQGTATNYELFIQQSQVGDVTVGAAVSQFQNPLTRSIMKMVVHPWYPQGNATLLSYQLPQTWTNVANAWEMSVVQDYVSIAWPTIDATFRYSLFLYGALVAHAPFYSAQLGGLQNSDVTPFS
jgi:hypothetical protein